MILRSFIKHAPNQNRFVFEVDVKVVIASNYLVLQLQEWILYPSSKIISK